MKKTNLFLGALALLLASSLVVTGCKQEPEPEPEVVNYTVTFDLNYEGATDAPEAQTVAENGTVTKPETDPARTGYDFGGWYNGEAEYDFTAAVTSDLTLKASWTLSKYTITYELSGGTNAESNPAEYTMESDDITLAVPTGPETAPTFVAWHTSAKPESGDWGDKLTGVAIAKGSTGNKTFYAEFTNKATYTITYYNGETSVGTETVIEGEKALGAAIAVSGYDFVKWYSDADLTTEATFDTAVSANANYYGKWTKQPVVTFKDGDEVIATKAVSNGKTVEAPSTEKKGYTMNGWYNGETKYDFATAVTADLVLTASWTPVSYTITYELDGGTNYDDAPTSYTIETKTITLGVPTKSGYDFENWYTDEAKTQKVTTITKGSTGNVTLYATWTVAEDPVITKIKQQYTFQKLSAVNATTNWFAFDVSCDKKLSEIKFLKLKIAMFDKDGKEITGLYGTCNFKITNSKGTLWDNAGWNNAVSGGSTESSFLISTYDDNDEFTTTAISALQDEIPTGLTFQITTTSKTSVDDGERSVAYAGVISYSWEALKLLKDPVTLLDPETWVTRTDTDDIKYSDTACAAAEVVTVTEGEGEDATEVKYIKVPCTSWNQMVFIPETFKVEGYSQITMYLYAGSLNDATNDQVCVSFHEFSTNWPTVAETSISKGTVPTTATKIKLNITNADNNIDMFKVFVQSTSTWSADSGTIYIGKIIAR